MGLWIALCFVFLSLCSASQYGRKSKRDRVICSGAPVGDLNLDLHELNGRWYLKFFKDKVGIFTKGPRNFTMDVIIPRNSKRAAEFVRGNNPVDGTCLQWEAHDFQLFDNSACVVEKRTKPEACTDEEWVHYIFGERRHMLFFFFCGDKNPGRRCDRWQALCFSRILWISKKDIADCQALWYRFNLGPLPDEDMGSANNAC